MSKLDYEKDHRKRKSKVRVVKKAGTANDYAGEDAQDEEVGTFSPSGKPKLLKKYSAKFKIICQSIEIVYSGAYLRFSDKERKEFLKIYYAAHNDIYFPDTETDDYYLTPEYRKTVRFFESVKHLIDEKSYWKTR